MVVAAPLWRRHARQRALLLLLVLALVTVASLGFVLVASAWGSAYAERGGQALGARGGGAEPPRGGPAASRFVVLQRNTGRLNNQLGSIEAAMRLAKATRRTLVITSPTHINQLDGLASVYAAEGRAGLWDARALAEAGFDFVMEHELPVGHRLRPSDRPSLSRLLTLIDKDRRALPAPRNYTETGPTAHPLLPGVPARCIVFNSDARGRKLAMARQVRQSESCPIIYLAVGLGALTCDEMPHDLGEAPQPYDAFFKAFRPAPALRSLVDAFYSGRHIAQPSVAVHSRIFMEGTMRDPAARRAEGERLCENIVLHRGGRLHTYLHNMTGGDEAAKEHAKARLVGACRLTPERVNEFLADMRAPPSVTVDLSRPWVRATDRYDRLLDAECEDAGAAVFGVLPGAYRAELERWEAQWLLPNGTARPRSPSDRGGAGGAMWERALLSKPFAGHEQIEQVPEVAEYALAMDDWFKVEAARVPPRDTEDYLPPRWGSWEYQRDCVRPDGSRVAFNECPRTCHQPPESWAAASGGWKRYLDELQFVALDMYAVVRADYFVGILSSSFSMAVCGMRGGEVASRSNICEAHFGICRAL